MKGWQSQLGSFDTTPDVTMVESQQPLRTLVIPYLYLLLSTSQKLNLCLNYCGQN